MKSLSSTMSKLEHISEHNEVKLGRINSLLVKPTKEKRNKIQTVDLIDAQPIPFNLLKYATFEVPIPGYYSISNQLCIKCNDDAKIHFIQFGICKDDLEDFDNCFESTIINQDCDKEYDLSHNLSSFKFLDVNIKYCAWLNFASSNNSNFSFNKDWSRLMLLKLSD